MDDGAHRLRLTVVYSSAPREVLEWALDMPAGATVLDALKASRFGVEFPDLQLSAQTIGVWGHKAQPDDLLKDGDRVEVYRPLRVDPKVARRERFRNQGTRSAGLFAKTRPGSKPGY